MKLIFIYGPPATGKLTVAKELSRLTGIPVFHNHLSLDYAAALFSDCGGVQIELSDQIRILTFQTAAKINRDLIFTFCYSYPQDTPYIEKIEGIIMEHGGTVYYVHLFSPREALKNRIVEESRKTFGKLTESEAVDEMLGKWDFYTPIPNRDSLSIDNSSISADSVARTIAKRYGLNGLGLTEK